MVGKLPRMRTQVKQGFFVITLGKMPRRDQARDYAGKRQLNQTVSRVCSDSGDEIPVGQVA